MLSVCTFRWQYASCITIQTDGSVAQKLHSNDDGLYIGRPSLNSTAFIFNNKLDWWP